MKTHILKTVDDFLKDDDFIRYTLDCEADVNGRWAAYLNATPDVRAAFLRATDILLHLDQYPQLTPEQRMRLKRRIDRTLAQHHQ